MKQKGCRGRNISAPTEPVARPAGRWVSSLFGRPLLHNSSPPLGVRQTAFPPSAALKGARPQQAWAAEHPGEHVRDSPSRRRILRVIGSA
jgi:hypothetical protein